MPSFDIVSKINLQELDNAVNQTKKEISTRFDFQGTHTEVTFGDDKAFIQLKSETEGRLEAALEVLEGKMVKRGVSIRCLDPGDVDKAALGHVKQIIRLKQGISEDDQTALGRGGCGFRRRGRRRAPARGQEPRQSGAPAAGVGR